MIRNFLRRPQTSLDYIADGVRALGALSVVVAAIFGSITDAGVLAFALPGLLIPRFLGLRAWFDITVSVTLLIAAWSNVLDLYTTIAWWDLAVHFVCTGVLAAVAYLGLADAGVVTEPCTDGAPARAPLVLVPALALAISTLWEMVEWFGYAFITDTISVGYADTIGDMAVGGLGGVCAGMMLAFVALRRPDAVTRATPAR